ncbi:MAG: DUF1684 domain-containing protein [Marinoscillum sp.]
MKKLAFILIPVVILIIAYSMSSGDNDQAYRQKVADTRSERVKYLKNAKESPFQQFDIKYQPVSFFPIDKKYNVRANLKRLENPTRIIVQNSDGTTNNYTKFAYAEFKIDGQPLKLLILKPAGFGSLPNQYFTAFADVTSGNTTYGGGRYLDLEIGKSDNIMIDFNLAYNPYCAYASEYSCPLPPTENILTIPMEAGEKDYKY